MKVLLWLLRALLLDKGMKVVSPQLLSWRIQAACMEVKTLSEGYTNYDLLANNLLINEYNQLFLHGVNVSLNYMCKKLNPP